MKHADQELDFLALQISYQQLFSLKRDNEHAIVQCYAPLRQRYRMSASIFAVYLR
jgi:hypothetical protein